MANSKIPAFNVFFAKDRGEGQKAWWTKIGCAWINRDGSLNIQLDFIPADLNAGTINLRKNEPRKAPVDVVTAATSGDFDQSAPSDSDHDDFPY